MYTVALLLLLLLLLLLEFSGQQQGRITML
jgi:hypothetical protein